MEAHMKIEEAENKKVHVRPTHTVMGRVLFLDEDLMGNRRGVHCSGAQLCAQYILDLPKNENDLSGLHCARCGRRDAEHVIIGQQSSGERAGSQPVAGATRSTSLRPALAPAPQALAPASEPARPRVSGESTGSTGATACSSARQLDPSTDPLARAAGTAASGAPRAVASGALAAATVEETARVVGRQQTAAGFKAEVERLVREGAAADRGWEEPADSGAGRSGVDDFKAEVSGRMDGRIHR